VRFVDRDTGEQFEWASVGEDHLNYYLHGLPESRALLIGDAGAGRMVHSSYTVLPKYRYAEVKS